MTDPAVQTLVDKGVEDGLAYAVGFLVGAATCTALLGMNEVAVAFQGAAHELATVTVAQVRADKQ